jgi:glycine betaine/proline transport system permease protein
VYDTTTELVLNPLDGLFADSPWWLVAAMILAVAALLGGIGAGPRNRVILGCALASIAVVAAGIWAANIPDIPWVPYWIAVFALLLVG